MSFSEKNKKATMYNIYQKGREQNLRKIFLLLCFLALCMTVYSLSSAYAAAITFPAVANNTKQPTGITGSYGSLSSALNLRPYGDPINDPRPQ
jgi:hypothetical protein